MKIIELKRCGDTCGHFDFKVVEGSNGNKVRWCWEARKQIPVPAEFINGFPWFCPLKETQIAKSDFLKSANEIREVTHPYDLSREGRAK